MSVPCFPTPEAAGMAGMPAEHVRVVGCVAEGDHGYVLLDTDPGGSGYLYGVNVYRTPGGWCEGSSSNGPGWTSTAGEGEENVGTLVFWGRAEPGVNTVRIEFAGETRDVPVHDGVYLTAWWQVPEAAW